MGETPRRVQFSHRYGIYNEGEVAGFDENRARELVEAGVAVYEGQKVPVKTAEPAKVEKAPAPDGAPKTAVTGGLASVVKQG